MKWVGGKTKMLRHLVPLYDDQRRIIEPFFGGGALSFHLAAEHPGLEIVANDMLAPVIEIYAAIRDDVDRFIADVDTYADPYLAAGDRSARRACYYQIREQYMTERIDGPAPLFFLLWCAYSGMFRTGKEYPGRFNTSHGFGNEKPGFYHPDRLRATAPLMRSWVFSSVDFADTLEHVDAASFVFLDPPYRGTYTGYTGSGFDEADQVRVAEFFAACDRAGARVVYTNKDLGDRFYDEHFAGYRIDRVPIKYTVNRNSAEVGRPTSFEVVISNSR